MLKIESTKKEKQRFIDMIVEGIDDCTLCIFNDECDKYKECADCLNGEIEWSITNKGETDKISNRVAKIMDNNV